MWEKIKKIMKKRVSEAEFEAFFNTNDLELCENSAVLESTRPTYTALAVI